MNEGTFRGFEVRVEDPGVAVVTMNQPERLNGMTQGLKRDLVETLLQAQMDDEIRVIVITGSGRAFSAGDDISGHGPEGGSGTKALMPHVAGGHNHPIGTYDGLRWLSQPLNTAVRNTDKLTIAAVNGVAIQTGLSLALSCDFRIASSDARLGSATLRFGLLPDEGGQYLLVRLLGVPRALDFLMRSRIVGADEALALGLVHEVVPPERLLRRALELARELAAGPQVAMRLLKRALYNAAELSWDAACEDIATKTAISDHHPDAREGVAAFREKRKPRFNEGTQRR
jgi:2-(1,2-epoxy-1,2-dihydrophenyl)acetyl-CoA isomerase